MSWLTKLNESLKDDGDVIPPGWWNSEAERVRLKIPESSFGKMIRDAVRLGILERRKFKIHNGKTFRRVYFYHECKPVKNAAAR